MTYVFSFLEILCFLNNKGVYYGGGEIVKKALFFDIDGTLMYFDGNNNIIPEGVKEELKRLKEKGYYIFIASGRPLAFLSQQITDLGFDGYILCNGSHVEVQGRLLEEKPIPYKEVKALKEFLDAIECEYDFETAENCYIDRKHEHLDHFFRQCEINQDKLLYDFDVDEIMKKTLKVEINTESCQKEIENWITGKFRYDTHGTQNSFEIYSLDVSKAKGIAKVLEYLDIPVEDSYAFGDGENDLEMIRFVGHGVAMNNAVESLKAIADEVIGDVKENGLALYLKTIQ